MRTPHLPHLPIDVGGWWHRGRHRRLGMLAVSTALGVTLGLALGHWRSSPGPFMRRLVMSGAWIKAPGMPGYAGYFRKHVRIPGPVKHAWICVAAREGYEVCVNQNPCGRFYLWRPTRPFQTGLNEAGQIINPAPAALALNFPREYQWTTHRNDWVPVFHDVTNQFKPGANVISVEVESRRAPAAFRLDGEIVLWSGEVIRFDSGPGWLAEPAPPFDSRYDWTETKYPDSGWRPALTIPSPSLDGPNFHWQSFDSQVLTTPFTGRWTRLDGARATDAVWFRGVWDFPEVPDDAWIRLATNRTFDLFVNDRRVSLALLGNPDLDSGDWVLGAPRGADLPAAPELLDPDEVGSIFVGDRFESPRHGDPSQLAFKPREDTLNKVRDKARATSRSDLPGTYDPIKDEGQDVMPHDPVPAMPEQHDAKAFGRDRAIGGLMAYNIRSMVKAGRNTIELRVIPPLTPEPFSWPPQLAVDGSALFRNGSRLWFATDPACGWTGAVQDPSGTLGVPRPLTILGEARVMGKPWPLTVYRGIAHDPKQLFNQKAGWLAGAILGSWSVAGLAAGIGAFGAWIHGRPIRLAVVETCGSIARFLLPPVVVLTAALLTENAWLERHESILFRIPRVWPVIFLVAAASPLALARPVAALAGAIYRLPQTKAWAPLLLATLVFCGVLRMYKLDFQPLDDDEYATCQADLAIAEVGTPKFVPDGVYYTRSPLHHYLVGAVVWVFGGHLWAMRLPSSIFGIATGLMIYRTAAKLMKRPWVGYGALFFFTIHPFAIFSAHLVRFYQQQQFCALVAFYWFCEGFVVGEQSMKYRYLTVLAFLTAVLSQEITAIMVFQLALGLFWFGRDSGWPNNIRLALVFVVSVAFIVLDLLVFQTWCLTRTEGVSPNVEASIKQHFWDPFNLASIFIGYSRLHVAPSIIMILSFWLLVIRGGRIVWAILFFLLTGVLLTNLMVTHVSLRYQYWMIPLLLLLAFRGLGLLADRLATWTRPTGEQDHRPIVVLLCAPICLSFLLAWSPWRIVHSYDCKLLNDSTGAFRYVRANLRPDDAVAANEPHPHAAYLESGRATYDLTVPMLYDFVVLVKGRLYDRNGGAEVISSIDDLMDACRRHERLWVVVNREKFRNRGKNLRWEYPGARLELFLRKNFQIAYKTYMWTVFLWDRSQGHYMGFRGQ